MAAATVTPTVKVAPIDERNGFRTHHFGDDVSTFSDLIPLPEKGEPGMKRYEMKKSKENLKIGEAKLNNIIYTFHAGKFYEVMLYTDGRDGLEKIIAAVNGLYGKPSYTYSSGLGGTWDGQKVKAYTEMRHMSGSYGSSSSDTGYLYIKSKTIDNQIEEGKKTAGKKASTDL